MSEQLLVSNDEYLKAGVHIGTKFKTKYMEKFIYKTRGDGLSVLDVQSINDRLKILINFLKNYEPEDILVVSRRENGWKPVKAFGKAIGARISVGRYPPGLLTNPNLRTFIEAKVLIATDSWPDRNAIEETTG
jgi:small subunit ribosomal protein S2